MVSFKKGSKEKQAKQEKQKLKIWVRIWQYFYKKRHHTEPTKRARPI